MSILYNSIDDANPITTKKPAALVFDNVGYIEYIPDSDPDIVWGTPYKIGKNAHDTYGNLNGRVAEILTFAHRVPDDDGSLDRPDNNSRQKIETYLAIKYGITLGAAQAEKNYVNSAGAIVWNKTSNAGFNYNIAGIGRDDSSDLNQKQSKSVNDADEVTIGLGGLYTKNSENINEFTANLDFLVWGRNNGDYKAIVTPNIVTITPASDITTSFTRINRKWKIVETGGDVGNTYVSIPKNAFDTSLNDVYPEIDGEYVLIVSDNPSFDDTNIIDVIPLKINRDTDGNPILDKEGSQVYKTWYDFDGTKYFTFGKAPKLSPTLDAGIERDTEKRSVNIIKAEDYLVGETALALNYNAFTISAWIRSVMPSAIPRTIMAKGVKMQMRLNSTNKVEVMLDHPTDARITSNMVIRDSKWHHITFLYDSGSIYLYIDGILDHTVQNVQPPTPNYNHFSVGAIYVDKNTIDNPFLGEIDEVYIWNRVLTQDQIRYLMNQETEKVTGSNLVNGKVLPQAITKNEVIVIPWSDLKVYYDFNAFYGSTIEGLTDDRDFLRINYLKKDKQIVEDQTAPLPYTTTAVGDGTWDSPDTWANSSVQKLPNSKGLDDSTYIDWNIVEASHNISSAGNKTLLGLIVNNTSTITASNNSKIEVSRYLKLDGVIDLQGQSQLMQTLNSDLEPTSAGYIKRNQQGVGNKYSYNYWSSPVGPIGEANNSNYSLAAIFKQGLAIKEGLDNIFVNTTSQDIDWIGGYDGKIEGEQIFLARYWLWKFENGKFYSNWVKIKDEYSDIRPSQGFTVKGASAVESGVQNYTFVGKPNNGSIALTSVLADNYFLVGNPYPSALDGEKFIIDNELTITGTIYFWEQSSGNNTHLLAGYTGGYSTLSIVGGVAPSDPAALAVGGGPIKPDGIAGLGSSYKVPKRFIPVGQGFFVIGKADGGGPIVFNNSQRGFYKEGSDESTYLFKNGAATKGKTQTNHFNDNSNDPIKDQKLFKIRLGFNTSDKFHRQLLLGFMNEKATDGEDYGYDAKQIDTRDNDMYFLINNSKYNIQGVGQFDVNKIYPLGINATIDGNVQFTLDEALNLPSDVSICILDKLTGEVHNISRQTFKVNLEVGEYLDRFALTFTMQKLVAEDVVTEVLIPAVTQPIIEGIHVFMNNNIKELQIKNNSDDEILSVALINTLGQTLKTWNSNFKIRTISLPINIATGIYIVQINTKTGRTVKKISVE
jgi:hypothetical protein